MTPHPPPPHFKHLSLLPPTPSNTPSPPPKNFDHTPSFRSSETEVCRKFFGEREIGNVRIKDATDTKGTVINSREKVLIVTFVKNLPFLDCFSSFFFPCDTAPGVRRGFFSAVNKPLLFSYLPISKHEMGTKTLYNLLLIKIILIVNTEMVSFLKTRLFR